jgi:hypothetical protein
MQDSKSVLVLVIALLWVGQAYAQSLGDVARQQRQKQADKPAASQDKVITDDDLPVRTPDADDTKAKDSSVNSPDKDEPINTETNAEQVKASFVTAKQQIADFQAQLEKLRTSVHYVDANAYSNGVRYNQYQLRKQQEVDRMQKQLERSQEKLKSMQEKARKAGFGSSVYDP